MKKTILSLLVTLFAVVANAQGFGGPMNPEDMAKFQTERVKEACTLNDDQYKAIYDIYLEQSKKMQEQMQSAQQGGNGMPRFDREAMKKQREEMNAKIKTILTEEQYAKYEEMQKQQRQRFGGGRHGGPRPEGGRPDGPGPDGPRD